MLCLSGRLLAFPGSLICWLHDVIMMIPLGRDEIRPPNVSFYSLLLYHISLISWFESE